MNLSCARSSIERSLSYSYMIFLCFWLKLFKQIISTCLPHKTRVQIVSKYFDFAVKDQVFRVSRSDLFTKVEVSRKVKVIYSREFGSRPLSQKNHFYISKQNSKTSYFYFTVEVFALYSLFLTSKMQLQRRETATNRREWTPTWTCSIWGWSCVVSCFSLIEIDSLR